MRNQRAFCFVDEKLLPHFQNCFGVPKTKMSSKRRKQFGKRNRKLATGLYILERPINYQNCVVKQFVVGIRILWSLKKANKKSLKFCLVSMRQEEEVECITEKEWFVY